MITVKPPKFTAIQEDLGTSIATGLWERVKACSEYIDASRPIGVLMFFKATQALVIPLDSRFWQFCDGSPISNPLSPLYGNNVPDLRGKFFRQALPGEPLGTLYGSDVVSYAHNHGGITGVTDDSGAINNNRSSTTGASNPLPSAHTHGINTETFSFPVIPDSSELQVYMRIL